MLALLQDSAVPEFWARWFGIVMVDLLLAGDNAIVIALAVRTLPKREQFLGRVWGTAGAVGLRLLFISLITYLMQVPLLQAIGGLALLWVAWKLLPSEAHHQPDGAEGKAEEGQHAPASLAPGPSADRAGAAVTETDLSTVGPAVAPPSPRVKAGNTLGQAVRIIIIADVSMSLDNVLAISATAHGDMVLVIAGIALTVPLVVWGSSLLTVLLNRLPWLVWIGGGVLGYVAGTLLVEDPKIQEWFGKPANAHLHPIPLGLGVAFILLGWWRSRTLGARPPS